MFITLTLIYLLLIIMNQSFNFINFLLLIETLVMISIFMLVPNICWMLTYFFLIFNVCVGCYGVTLLVTNTQNNSSNTSFLLF